MNFKIINQKGKVICDESVPVKMKSGVNVLYEKELKTKKWKGKYLIEASLTDQSEEKITSNQYAIDVFSVKALTTKPNRVALLNSNSKLEQYLQTKKIQSNSFDAKDLSTPLIITQSSERIRSNKVRSSGYLISLKGVGPFFFLMVLENP